MTESINQNVNALLENQVRPHIDLVGPTVDDDIRRAINRYGIEAVRVAIAKHSKKRPGRQPVAEDLPELRCVFEEDARAFLDGGDPLRNRTDYSIAKEFADKHPGQSHPATMRRITRKLKQKRKIFTYIIAMEISEVEYSYIEYIRSVKFLIECSGKFEGLMNGVKALLGDYLVKFDALPLDQMTYSEIERAVKSEPALTGRYANGRT